MRDLERIRTEYHLEGVPSVDLTGAGSGYLLQLGTRPLGRASFFGFLPGAENGARFSLAQETCTDRASAWVLYAKDNPADVSAAFLSKSLDLDRDYEVVATFHPTQGPDVWRPLTLRLLRPRPSAVSALGCNAGRGGGG